MTLVAPDGTDLDVEVLAVDHEPTGVVATFRLDGDDWDRVRAAGLLHVQPERLLAGEELLTGADEIEIEVALDPDVELTSEAARTTTSWWALNATRPVALPADLAASGSLREGVALIPPAWRVEGDLVAAWRAVAPPMNEDGLVADEPMLDLITAMLEEQGWELDRPDLEVTIVRAPVSTDDGDHVLWIRTSEEQFLVTVYSAFELDVPAERIPAMLELAARLNKHVYVGGFEVDPDSGDFSFRNGIDVEGAGLTIPLARQVVGHALVAAEKVFPIARAVAEGRYEPAQAATYF